MMIMNTTAEHNEKRLADEAPSRRQWLLMRLMQADGPAYDELCREIIKAFPHPVHRFESQRGVRAVRELLSDGLATTENDESCWLTVAGWARAGEQYQMGTVDQAGRG